MCIRIALVSVLLGSGVAFWACDARGQQRGGRFERNDRPESSQAERDQFEQGELEPLETDRDSFTPATTTVDAGLVIFEAAYSFLDNRNTADNHSFPEIITRFGMTERLELRLGWNYETGGGGSVSSGDAGDDLEEPGTRQESQLLYGVKYEISQQADWIPQSACIIQAASPTSGPSNFTDFQIGYVVGYKFFDEWRLDSAVRYISTKEEDDHLNQWAPSVVLKVPVGDGWNVHAEYFGIFTEGSAANRRPQYVSPGIHYLFTPNCEVGIRVGWGLNQDAANFFTNVGCGLRF